MASRLYSQLDGDFDGNSRFSDNGGPRTRRSICRAVQRVALSPARQETCTITLQDTRGLQKNDRRGCLENCGVCTGYRVSVHQQASLAICTIQVSMVYHTSIAPAEYTRTYGIPSISKLLCETQQLGKVEYAGRRYADTSILIVEFLANSPSTERANAAIARMNWLHGRYQKAGKISNDDMLYTLSLFVLEVPRWVNQYEWRTLTPMETCAM